MIHERESPMGLYDRSYYQDEERRGISLGARSLVVNLILINVGVWVADLLSDGRISDALSLKSNLPQKPWLFWQLLTYGFLHDPNSVWHILFNMFGLWLFGTDLEVIYGRNELLRMYLTAIVVAGLAWVGVDAVRGVQGVLIGASGAVMALMIVFVLHFPRRIFLLWAVLPIPAWGLAVIYVLTDLFGAVHGGDDVAHVAHLSGVAYGFVYYRTGWSLGSLIPRRLSWPALRPRLKVHDPASDDRDLNKEVDQILEKISRTGEASLTKKERQTLERASRRYQRRRE